jgi:NADPH:quinone reductase-like Zn-dependent oxidoreductase
MNQVWIPRFGGPEVLEVRSAPDPHAGAGEVRIAVAAAGVNFADVLARAGLYPDAPKPPMVVGYEVAGVVDEVGPGVEQLAVGNRVVALTRFGGYSSSAVVPVARVLALPEGKDIVHAAGLPVTFMTAHLLLNRLGSLRSGERVLIHAVAGGVGLAALQLARRAGAVTIGTASRGKHDRLRELGLDHPIDYRSTDFEAEVMRFTNGRGVDVVLDAVGGVTTRKSYRCLAPLGRLLFFGLSSASAPSRRQAWRTFPPALLTTPLPTRCSS